MAVLPNTIFRPVEGRSSLRDPTRTHQDAIVGTVTCDSTLQRPHVSVIVPTKNESANIKSLLQRIQSAAATCVAEVIFVDDSTDDTPAVIESFSDAFPFPIRLIARPAGRRNGLGRAVVEGIRVASGEWVCVMDGDLQHPPEIIPQLLAKAASDSSNIVIASRLAEGGSTAGLSPARSALSRVLAICTRLVFPQRLCKVTDPLTGYFLVRRDCLEPDQLHPEGFKILLEILIQTPNLRLSEVPFEFADRTDGASKANGREVLRLFRQMVKLALLSQHRLLMFLTVGLSGLFVNSLLLVLFAESANMHYLLAAILAAQGSTLWNFAWTERWVFRGRGQNGNIWARALGFFAINNAALLLRGPMLVLFVSMLGMHYVFGNLLSIAVMTLVRYVVADKVIWRSRAATDKTLYYYNIHDIIRVRSVQKLPELGYFRSLAPLRRVDIDVKVENDLAAYRTSGSIAYDEFLGRYGFSILINQGEQQTEVVAAPLVGRSPHVLYTNVIEPLLRWHFARKGYALMHGATLAFGSEALFITARTDTGKTTTILHTMRNNLQTSHFLSDDMSILSADGVVRSYPKPLTISKHTLQAIGGAPLSLVEYTALQIQSRIHSKSGRRFAMLISALHLPAATINTIVQMFIPPPKYMVDRIIPEARYGEVAQLGHIVLIERGNDFQEPLPEDAKFAALIANAEDAYGFPPYPQIAPRLAEWQGEDLHAVEQRIVTAAVAGLPATRLGSSTFDWYRHLPVLISKETSARTAVTQKDSRPRWVMPEPRMDDYRVNASAD